MFVHHANQKKKEIRYVILIIYQKDNEHGQDKQRSSVNCFLLNHNLSTGINQLIHFKPAYMQFEYLRL